jgi:hypothetical protein
MVNNNPIDFERLAVQLLPALLRKPRLVAWLQAMLFPLRQLYAGFLDYAARARVELAYNSQTILFEKALNDQFDPTSRRIYIDHPSEELQPLYLNFISENQPPTYLGFAVEGPPFTYLWLYTKSEFDAQTDFIVRVPPILYSVERATQLHARIQHFKLATRRYLLKFSL